MIHNFVLAARLGLGPRAAAPLVQLARLLAQLEREWAASLAVGGRDLQALTIAAHRALACPAEPAGPPAARALGAFLAAHNLPPAAAAPLIDSLALHLFRRDYRDAAQLAPWWMGRHVAPLLLGARLLGFTVDAIRRPLVGLGEAIAQCHIAADFPLHHAAGRLLIPLADLRAAGVDPAGLVGAADSPALRACLAALAKRGAESATRHAATIAAAAPTPRIGRWVIAMVALEADRALRRADGGLPASHPIPRPGRAAVAITMIRRVLLG